MHHRAIYAANCEEANIFIGVGLMQRISDPLHSCKDKHHVAYVENMASKLATGVTAKFNGEY